MAGQVPVEAFVYSGQLSDLANGAVALLVAADVTKALHCGVAADEGGGPAVPEGGEGYLQEVSRLLLLQDERAGTEVGRGERLEVTPAQACVATEEEGIAHVAEVLVCQHDLFECRQFRLGEVFAPCLDFGDAYVAEGVVVHADDIALDGFVDQAPQGFQPTGNGVGREVPLGAHPVLPPLNEVVGEFLDLQVGVEPVERMEQGAIDFLGARLASRRFDDGVYPLGNGGRAGQVVPVGFHHALRVGFMARIKHFVFQLHQSAHNAAYASIEQVVVGV